MVIATLRGPPRILRFKQTAYIPDSDVTLVSANKLKEEGFIWDIMRDTVSKGTSETICNLEEHYGLCTLKFNPISNPLFATYVAPCQKPSATAATYALE